MTERLLVVEDDAQQRQLLCELLRAEDYQVQSADSVETAILALKQQPLDLVLCDWKLGQGSGLQVLQYLRQHYPQLGFVVATAYGSVSHAVEAIQA
ncbi:Fis family transcriptional regulator, partial [Alishewanella sp. WH16-1]